MNCRERQELLGAYVDGELDLSATLELEQHLATCTACSARAEELRKLSRTIRSRASRFAADREFSDTLRASLRSSAPRVVAARATFAGREQIRRLLIAAAAVVVAWMGGVWWARPAIDARIGEDVVAAHIRSLQAGHLTDVASSDRHTVNPWFQGKLSFAVKAEDYSARGFALSGARLDYILGSEAAALVYRHGNHVLNVFEWPSNGDVSTDPRLATIRGYAAQHWIASGLNVWVVSDADPSALAELTALLRGGGS
jgi:anti-sigma factor RsiW